MVSVVLMTLVLLVLVLMAGMVTVVVVVVVVALKHFGGACDLMAVLAVPLASRRTATCSSATHAARAHTRTVHATNRMPC